MIRWLAVFWMATAACARAGAVDFALEVRPILADHCFACHGPDPNARKSGLRLDVLEDALKPAKSGARAIVPGDAASSELIRRILTPDADERMPPAAHGKALTDSQIDILRRWIVEGATWSSHWAFVPPRRPPVPTEWIPAGGNAIDGFVREALARAGMKPGAEADQATLLRRLTLDLTGMPPTVNEMDAFPADPRPGAYARVVDRLLASTRYGEHMARYWLDAVRYADSHGYHLDTERQIWPYRDWVIRAFNDNMPFDQFTLEQLAGDLLPNASDSQRVASGYVRCNLTTNEGGAIEEEYQAKYGFDRTETTATAWLGLTLICARCHTHKYDPIAQTEYYGLFAFLNNLDVPVMDQNVPHSEPHLKLPTPAQRARQLELRAAIEAAQQRIAAPAPALDSAQTDWEASRRAQAGAGWTELKTDPALVASNEWRILASAAPGPIAALRVEWPAAADFPLGELELQLRRENALEKVPIAQIVSASTDARRAPEKLIDGRSDTHWEPIDAADRTERLVLRPHAPLRLSADTQLELSLKFPKSPAAAPVAVRVLGATSQDWVEALSPATVATPWKVIGPLPLRSLQHGYDQAYPPEQELDFTRRLAGAFEEVAWEEKPRFQDGRDNVLVPDVYSLKGNGVFYLHRRISAGQARRARIRLRADDIFKLWLNGKLIGARPAPEFPGQGPLEIDVQLNAGANELLLKVVNYEAKLCYFNYRLELTDPTALAPDLALVFAAGRAFSTLETTRLRDHFRSRHAPGFARWLADLERWQDEDAMITKHTATTLVARELAQRRDTHLLVRGEYDKKGDKMAPGVPAVLHPFPEHEPPNRLGLARWLARPENPLTARVIVNRFWQQYFGVGLVKTAEDFGIQGEPPSHPELLDWLATEFVQGGWNVKDLQRTIVLSATYRQSARATPEQVQADPENRRLARGPRFRADAEMIRDGALAISGLLVERLGGRSAKPYEPPGLWEAVSHQNRLRYAPDAGEGQFRRSVYTFWKRQSPPPTLLALDAPTREACVVRRPRTTTPMQALALLNDPQFAGAAEAFGRLLVQQQAAAGPEHGLRWGFRRATGRLPAAAEVRIMNRVLQQAGGPGQHGAWTAVASLLLNLDEVVTKN